MQSNIFHTNKSNQIKTHHFTSRTHFLSHSSTMKSTRPVATPHKHGFVSYGTHCLTYVSPEARTLIGTAEKSALQVAAFDLDDTLVKTKSGTKFARNADDWKWWNENVPVKLREWVDEHPNGLLVIFTNQGGVTNNAPPAKPSLSMTKLLDRLHAIAAALAPLPLVIYAATKQSSADKKLGRGSSLDLHSRFRKPGPGMWEHLIREKLNGKSPNRSFYVGDAAGRKGDFADTDKAFAESIGIPFFTPEEFFTNISKSDKSDKD